MPMFLMKGALEGEGLWKRGEARDCKRGGGEGLWKRGRRGTVEGGGGEGLWKEAKYEEGRFRSR